MYVTATSCPSMLASLSY